MINEHKREGEWKIQLRMAIKFMSFWRNLYYVYQESECRNYDG